jgi:hypothetical protein
MVMIPPGRLDGQHELNVISLRKRSAQAGFILQVN